MTEMNRRFAEVFTSTSRANQPISKNEKNVKC